MARFPRRARLLKPADFKAVFESGKRHSEKHLTAVVATGLAPHPRLGLAIAKKSVAQAVDRNRIKRLVRESFREHQAQMQAADTVILARNSAVTASAAELRANLLRIWTRLHACAASPSS